MERQMVPLGDIKTHPALQPRDPALLKLKERGQVEKRSEAHIEDMARLLKLDPKAELVPVTLAEVKGELLLVDGHHRCRAYKKAGRKAVPAVVESMTLTQASHQSKVANVTHAKLEMHPEQKRNALWHHLHAITQGGTLSLPEDESLRKLGGRFGAAPETVRAMVRRLAEVDPEEFPREHRDGITGWPHWKYVKQYARNDLYRLMTEQARIEWAGGKYLKKLTRLWEQYDPDAIRWAHNALIAEGADVDLIKELEAAHWAVLEEPSEF